MDKARGELHLNIPKASPGVTIFKGVYSQEVLKTRKIYVTQQVFNELAQEHPYFPVEGNFEPRKNGKTSIVDANQSMRATIYFCRISASRW